MAKFTTVLLAIIIGVLITSCKQKVEPTLIVNVQDDQGAPLSDITVYSHPCFDGGCDLDRLREDFVKEKLTNEAGEVIFEFPYSSVLDIIAKKPIFDPITGEILDYQVVRNVVAIETKELKKGEKNEYETSIMFPGI